MLKNRPTALFPAPLVKHLYVVAFVVLSLFSAAVAANEFDRRSLTILEITPGENTFGDVVRHYGEASQWHTGDAASSETKMCFRFGSGNATTNVVFASNSEMAGAPRYVVTDIRLYSTTEPFPEAQRCTQVLIGQYNLSTNSGLHLGASASDVNGILGNHQRRENSHVVWVTCQKTPLPQTDPKYEYWSKQEGCFEDEHGSWNGKPYFNACAGVTIGFKNGKVTYLELSSADSIC